MVPVAKSLLASLKECYSQVCYLKPEAYDDPEHEANFLAMLDRWESAIDKAEVLR